MRIRKNAKNISALLYTNTNVSKINVADECLQQKNYNFCELNQSPWDIITFPSSNTSSNTSSSFHQFNKYEVDYNVNVAGYGSSIGSVGAFESVALKTSGISGNDNVEVKKKDCGEILGFKEGDPSDQIQEEVKLCGEIDEKGWQCGSVVTKGNTMCDFHLSEFQNCAVWTTTKKKYRRVPMTGARPHRAKKRPTTNPHEYYYYSGFGPSWGKKRGATGAILSGIDSDKNIQENGKRLEPKMSEIGPMELDSMDDDDDNYNDDEKGKFKLGVFGTKRLKRVRKPVKERSLKSLM